jgi:hypothetical protein
MQHQSDTKTWDLALWANTSEPAYNHELGDGQDITSILSTVSQHQATLEVAQMEAVNRNKMDITLQYSNQLLCLRNISPCEIPDSHSSEHKDDSLPEYCTVQSHRS